MQPDADRPPRRSSSTAGEPQSRRASNTGAAPNQAAALGGPRLSRDPPLEDRRPSASGASPGGQPGGSRRPSVYPEVFSAAEANAYPAPVQYPAVSGRGPCRQLSCVLVASCTCGCCRSLLKSEGSEMLVVSFSTVVLEQVQDVCTVCVCLCQMPAVSQGVHFGLL